MDGPLSPYFRIFMKATPARKISASPTTMYIMLPPDAKITPRPRTNGTNGNEVAAEAIVSPPFPTRLPKYIIINYKNICVMDAMICMRCKPREQEGTQTKCHGRQPNQNTPPSDFRSKPSRTPKLREWIGGISADLPIIQQLLRAFK